jgi:hypothetical protein
MPPSVLTLTHHHFTTFGEKIICGIKIEKDAERATLSPHPGAGTKV